eukprot:jgi/Bigna1/74991/fgenesh1_pg.32_\
MACSSGKNASPATLSKQLSSRQDGARRHDDLRLGSVGLGSDSASPRSGCDSIQGREKSEKKHLSMVKKLNPLQFMSLILEVNVLRCELGCQSSCRLHSSSSCKDIPEDISRYHGGSIAESLYVSMNWNITMPVRIDLAFKLALFLVIASLVSSTIAVLVTNEIQWNGYILFPTICLLHLWFTPYMMYVILALYYKIADHLHTLRAHFYGYSMETGGPLSDYQTSFDAQDDSVLAKAVVAVVTSPPCTDNPISPTAGSRYGTGDSWNVPMCATNKDEKNRYQQQQQLPPGSPKSSSSMGKKMTRSSNTTMHSGQRSGNTTTSTSAPTKRGSNPKAAVSKSHYQIARSRELRKFESAMRKTRIVFVVWTICGIIAPVFSLITAVNLSRSDASASERRDRQFAEGSFNLLATISTLCLVLFNSLIVWSFGGPWRCYSRN